MYDKKKMIDRKRRKDFFSFFFLLYQIMSSACFWAILSADDFRFIYVSDITRSSQIKDRILDHSLLKFIHPEELPLAKADLLHFMKIKSLASAVTRYIIYRYILCILKVT